MFRWFGIALTGAVVLFAGLFAWSAAALSDSGEGADDFLRLVANDKIGEAYQAAMPQLRNVQSRAAFEQNIRSLGVTGYRTEWWVGRALAGLSNGDVSEQNRLVVKATLQTESRGNIAVEITLIWSGRDWRVLTMTGPGRHHIGNGVWFRHTPPEGEVRALVQATIQEFSQAFATGDFSNLIDSGSLEFRKEASAQGLLDAYRGYVDAGVHLSNLKPSLLEIDEPPQVEIELQGIRRDGTALELEVLVVSGGYATGELSPGFTFEYTYDHPEWLLSSFDLSLPEPRNE